jgi:hypothetical protein
MTAHGFRRLALGMSGAIEAEHMGHPDFRANGKIFATLGYPDSAWGMVKLTAEQQREFIQRQPSCFQPVKGKWGLQGNTLVRLENATDEILGEALTEAWRGAIAKKAVKKSGARPKKST